MGMNGKDGSISFEGEFSKSCEPTFGPKRAMDDDVDAEVPSSGSKVHHP